MYHSRFARKTKLVQRPEETAWLFHEIGDCFLSLGQYGYGRDAGRKSLEAAQDAQHRMYQLQACVLIGVAQGENFKILIQFLSEKGLQCNLE